jgi:hypothetical protein
MDVPALVEAGDVDKTARIIKPSEIVSFEADDIKEILFLACSRKGFFSPNDKMRGRGAWTFRNATSWSTTPATSSGSARRAASRRCRPASMTASCIRICRRCRRRGPRDHAEENPAASCWPASAAANGRGRCRPDPAAGLDRLRLSRRRAEWRPSVLLLGDKGTGKSTLQDTLKNAVRRRAVPFVRQHRGRHLPGDGPRQPRGRARRNGAGPDERKASNIADLMRTSASGAIGRRGSAGGTASEFQMRSAFLFSAINNPLHTAAICRASRCCACCRSTRTARRASRSTPRPRAR